MASRMVATLSATPVTHHVAAPPAGGTYASV